MHRDIKQALPRRGLLFGGMEMDGHIDLSKLVQNGNLSETEAAVLAFIVEYRDSARKLGVRGIARECYTSPSTVMRLAKKLGYRGYVDMCYRLQDLSVESREASGLRSYETAELWGIVEGLDASYRPFIERASELLAGSELSLVYGEGYSSLIAEYFTKKLLGTGGKVLFTSAVDSVAIFESLLPTIDALVLFSRSGRTQHVLDRLDKASSEGIPSIAITGVSTSPLAEKATCTIWIEDDQPFDDRNTKPTAWFSKALLAIEAMAALRQMDVEAAHD
jgi:DNA-binding MurR/RpiR family transcriptional regulator